MAMPMSLDMQPTLTGMSPEASLSIRKWVVHQVEEQIEPKLALAQRVVDFIANLDTERQKLQAQVEDGDRRISDTIARATGMLEKTERTFADSYAKIAAAEAAAALAGSKVAEADCCEAISLSSSLSASEDATAKSGGHALATPAASAASPPADAAARDAGGGDASGGDAGGGDGFDGKSDDDAPNVPSLFLQTDGDSGRAAAEQCTCTSSPSPSTPPTTP